MIVNRLEEAETTSLLLKPPIVHFVDDCGDASTDLAVAKCQKRLDFRLEVEWVLLVTQQFLFIGAKWGNPVGISAIEFPGKLEKPFFFPASLHWLDDYIRHKHRDFS